VEILEYNFNKVNKHPDPTTLCLIAAEAGLSEEETQIPRSELWHPESNPQREGFPTSSLLPLALDYFSLLPPHSTKKWFKQRLAQWRLSEGLPSECRSVTD
ncbi:hypothetical protein E2I00_013237, partial [Balaenoptera physalus]